MKIETKDYKAKRIYYNEILSFKLTKYTGDQEHFAVPDSIICVGGGAFAGNSVIREITFPQTLAMIGESAFADCPRIQSISLPDPILEIKKNTFEGCTHLTDIKLPERLQVIGHGAFLNCVRLESLVIPKSVKLIYGMESRCQFKLCTDVSSSGHSSCSTSACGSSSGQRMYKKGKNVYHPSAFENCRQLAGLYFLGEPPKITGDLLLDDSVAIYCQKNSISLFQKVFKHSRCLPLP